MKPRRVILTLEVETEVPLALLRDKRHVGVMVYDSRDGDLAELQPIQAQANVVRPAKPKGKSR